jgi:hypothetical protein
VHEPAFRQHPDGPSSRLARDTVLLNQRRLSRARPAHGKLSGLDPGGNPIHDLHVAGRRGLRIKIISHTATVDVPTLLGHESFATTMRCAHLALGAHDKVIASRKRRTEDSPDASVTHE